MFDPGRIDEEGLRAGRHFRLAVFLLAVVRRDACLASELRFELANTLFELTHAAPRFEQLSR